METKHLSDGRTRKIRNGQRCPKLTSFAPLSWPPSSDLPSSAPDSGGTFSSADRSGEVLAPFVRVAGRVKDGVDGYRPLCILVEYSIWKAPYQGAAIGLINHGVQLRLSTDAFQTRIHRTQELLSQPRSPTFIPTVSLGDVEFGFRRNNQFSGHTAREPFALRRPRKVPQPDF